MNNQLRQEQASLVQVDKSRVANYDWTKVSEELSSQGCAVIERLLSSYECRQVAALYSQEGQFRSHVHMARHGFGRGEYRYFRYPLPELLSGLRAALYPHLAMIANDWNGRMNIDRQYPAQHADFLKECHDAGQTRPTPRLSTGRFPMGVDGRRKNNPVVVWKQRRERRHRPRYIHRAL